jgi:hypothetical protein
MCRVHSSTSNSDLDGRSPFFNRHFTITFVALLGSIELFLRLTPHLDPVLFRGLYGNSLSIYMTIRDRLDASAGGVRILGLGDSLAMTQFQPDLFGSETGLERGQVFNAAYLGMSFPSQEDLLADVGVRDFGSLTHVLYFLNPRRLSTREVPNTDVLRVGVPPARGVWREARERKRVGPILDRLRASRGGVRWRSGRADPSAPRYPYAPLAEVSSERLGEMERVLALLRNHGARVVIVPSAVHPAIDPFASDAARDRFHTTVNRLAESTGSDYLPGALDGFRAPSDQDFCDYGHMNAAGGEGEAANPSIRELNALLQRLASSQVDVADLHAAVLDEDGLLAETYSRDGLHFRKVAYLLWRDRLEAAIGAHAGGSGR